MTILALAGCALLGFVVANVIWILANQQIRGAAIGGRPVCFDCGAYIAWSAVLPLGAIWGRGACPDCGAAESRNRLWWELAVAVYFAAIFQFVDRSAVPVAILGSLPLLLILLVDFKCGAVFVGDCYVAILAGVGLALFDSPRQAANAVAGMAIAAGAVLVFLVLSRWILRSIRISVSPIGKSDVFIGLAVGAIVRADAILPALVMAVVFVGMIGVLLPIVRPVTRGRAAPFGPYLVVGGLLAQLI